jgi:hypothetical protein
MSAIYRCQRCRAYVHTSGLEWIGPRRWACRDLDRCLRGVRRNIYFDRIVALGKKRRTRVRL